MLSPELVAEIKKIQYKAGHLVTESLAGEYVSAFKGQGMEFDEVREYVPGDDIRSIDWNVTARMNHPFVKVFREERELTMMLVVDVSGSQQFGSGERSKAQIAAEFAAILAYLATKNNDKVGLILFSDHVEHYIPAKKGRSHIWRIIKEVLSFKSSGTRTNVSEALEFLIRVNKKKSLCFLVSDFFVSDFELSVRNCRRRHDLVCARIEDPIEAQVPQAGLVMWTDAESGRRLLVDTSSKKFQQKFQDQKQTRLKELERFFKKSRIDQIELKTDQSLIVPLEKYFRRRERRR